MTLASETIFRAAGIAALANAAPGRVQHAHSLPPSRVTVPPLPTGGNFFELWPVRELPAQGMWKNGFYDSFAPPLFVLRDVVVHSSAGIIAIGDTVVSETLERASPETHAYRGLASGIAVDLGRLKRLRGIHVSVLAGGEQNYRHAMLGGLARLMAVPANYLAAASSVLVPEGGACQMEALKLFDLLPSLAVREVSRRESLLVDTLIFPLCVCGEETYHPCVGDFFRRLSANVTPAPGRLPRRFYIDSSISGLRPLFNEQALIAALARMGFQPVRLEFLSLADQIRLFRQAEAIVAPHGMGLTNLGFARPGCVVIELLMDAYVDWCYRHLAALGRLHYDCVIGRARRPWRDLDLHFHTTAWEVSVHHVVAAAAHAMGGLARAA